MPQSLLPNRTPFRNLLKLVDDEYSILLQECELLRSRVNFIRPELGRELTGRDTTGLEMISLSPQSETTPNVFSSSPAGKAKSCPIKCRTCTENLESMPSAACVTLVGASVARPCVLKAATEDGPHIKPNWNFESQSEITSATDGAFLTPKADSPRHSFTERNVFKSKYETRRFSLASNKTFTETTVRRVIATGRVSKLVEYIKSSSSFELPSETKHSWVRIFVDRAILNLLVDAIMAIVIVMNMFYVGVCSELTENNPFVVAGDITFAALFVIERILKLYILGLRRYFFGVERGWNIFETVLSVVGVAEVVFSKMGASIGDAPTPLLRLIRLSRIAKMIRLLRLEFVKELMVMVNIVLGGVRTLAWSIVLICIPLYIASLILRETAGRLGGDNGSENFSSIQSAFFTMFRCVVVGDCSDMSGRPIFLMLATNHGWQYAAVYVVTTLLMTFGLFNVIVAIYVENTVAAAKHNEMVMKFRRLENQEAFSVKTAELLELVRKKTSSGRPGHSAADLLSCQITAELFNELCQNPRFRDLLCELDIAEEDQVDLFDTLDVDGGGILDAMELINGLQRELLPLLLSEVYTNYGVTLGEPTSSL
eukprot:TRINITY_DN20098_c0_g2_i1.p1 TRINITY_DN20098_c0_g2~~TRINITY_DN20098_c0_g2_i1.p1  ORF type:complete len:608 (-),score=78.06 TRINITY_DN20098_c0_g2_i1:164-1957(-)